MDFSYTATGSVIISGCTKVTSKKKYAFQFAIRSKVYDVKKAKRGLLEYVWIKNVLVRRNKYAQIAILYVDTLNGLWNERDLCDHETALGFAINYLENLQSKIQDLVVISCLKQQCETEIVTFS